ncbi:MAG TPA: hypothetical protein VFT45_08625 [Longimicrobium sp.]|nr:hypothetical protein [Longimicrobium sp.]
MPSRRASILPPIALCGLLLIVACARGSARQEEAAAADSSAAARTDVSAAGEPAEARESVKVTALPFSVTTELRIETTQPGDPVNLTTIQVGEDTLLVDSLSSIVEVFGWWHDPRMMAPEGRTPAAPLGSTALLKTMSGGSGCPAQFRVVEMTSDGSSFITEEFGTCAEWPDAVWFGADGTMRMRFGDYASASVRSEPGFREDPPTTWIYRTGGRLEVMRGR